MALDPRRASNGRCYLNVGCGSHFSPEWNNLDLHAATGVVAHDVRRRLPFAEGTFDAVYSSHVLEHLPPEAGGRFMREQARVLKPGGICRLAVPDLERNCRDYLEQLERAEREPTPRQILDYHWSVLQLIDQLVREECGGEMLKSLRRGEFNADYLQSRFGDEFGAFASTPAGVAAATPPEPPGILQNLKARARRILGRDARGRGEAHRWMYDRFSLRLVLERAGLIGFRIVSHLESRIVDWDRFGLDLAHNGVTARKPDSLFVEAAKPA